MVARTLAHSGDAMPSVKPDPDPTVLTTQALHREMLILKELLQSSIGSLKEIFDTRLAGMDKAVVLLKGEMSQDMGTVTQSVVNLQKLHEERFRSVDVQFKERDERTVQITLSSKEAIAAALQAAKEAVGEQQKSNAVAIQKSETAFADQIKQLGALLVSMQKTVDDKFTQAATLALTTQKGQDDKVSDVKDRVQSIESQKKGSGDMWGYVFGMAGVVMAIVAVIALVMTKTH